MNEPWLAQIEHHLNLGTSLVILGFLVTQHKIWVRMKDRLNQLWRRHCQTTGDEYTPLENGHHGD